MAHSSRHSSIKSQNPVFVPSPRWLSESPANRGISGHVDYPGPGTSISDHSQTPSFAPNLRSPIPPPPANLYPGSPAAFNVDPGIPFLATAGPTEDGSSSDHGSIKDEELPQRGFGGALMSGIKHVVRKSLRDRTRPQQPPNTTFYTQPPQFRDSGYAESSPLSAQLPPPPPAPLRMPEFPHASSPSSRRTVHSVRPPSETLLGHQDDGDDRDEATMIGHQNSISVGKQKWKPSQNVSRPHHQLPEQNTVSEIPPRDAPQRPRMYPEIVAPATMASPVSAELEYDPNYLQMDIKTPPPSEISLNTYIKRFQQAVRDFNNLPWIGKERITKDYFPERSRRSDEPKHHPAIAWRSDSFAKLNIPASDPENPTDYNETDSSTSSIGPGLRAPRKGSYTAMNLDAEFAGNHTQASFPPNPPDMTPGSIPHRTMPPDIPVPPNSMLLQDGPPPRLPPPPILPVPSSVHVTYERYPPNPPPNGPWVEIKVPQFYIPPSNVTNMQPPSIGGPSIFIPPFSMNVPSAPPVPTPAQSNGFANDRTQPVGDPSHQERRPSFQEHRDEWEAYPLERTGYVPYQYSEHYYGDQYGAGIHAARPPLAPPPLSSGTSSASA